MAKAKVKRRSLRGRFITFEGGEGAGKSTQIGRLAEKLRDKRYPVATTREPGGSPGAEAIRALLVSGDAERWSPQTEALLINAARADHLERTIRPALAQGQWVICDRFADSTMAYQGYGMGLDRAWLEELRRRVVADTEPGLTLIFDLPVEVGLGRAVASQRYEKMGRAFHDALRAAFATESAYMPSSPPARPDPFTVSHPWSRRASGVPLFAALAELGAEGYARMVDAMTERGDELRDKLRAAGFRVVNDTPLPLVCFTHPAIETRSIASGELARRVRARGRRQQPRALHRHAGPRLSRAAVRSRRAS